MPNPRPRPYTSAGAAAINARRHYGARIMHTARPDWACTYAPCSTMVFYGVRIGRFDEQETE